jgi:nitrogen regulatory protein PII
MKMVFITYNVAIHDEVMEMLQRHGVETYTRWEHVTGVGKSSGPHLDTHVWPARNSAIATATTDEKAGALLEAVREMRQSMSGEGIKAFLIPVEEAT